MPLNFPSNPSLNDTYSFGGKTWIWDGQAWALQSSGAINAIPIGNVTPSTGAFTTISGDGSALTGVLNDRGTDSNNWNTLTDIGVYKVNRDSWSGTTGTPTDSTIFVGILQVVTSDNATVQIFYPGTTGDDANNVRIQWNRSLWSGSWTAWYKIINDRQIVDAGSY